MTQSLQVGGVRCHILSDGLNLADGGGFFGVVPKLLWQRVIQPNEQNLVPSDTRSLLIESDAGLILVDTGVGDKLTAKQRQILGLDERRARLVHDLARVGFRPEDVEIVVLTHFHNDHAGGSTRWDTPDGSPGPLVATFPNARYLAQRMDLEEARCPNERTAATYFADNWEPLFAGGQMELLDGPVQLGSQVRTEVAPGHTGAIQVVWVEAAGEALVFLGDACSWAVHLERLAWVPAYDILPMTSIETKRHLRQTALDKDALLVFQHDPQVITGRLAAGARSLEVQPIWTKGAWDDPLA